MSNEFEFYHGAALCKIIHSSPQVAIKLYSEKSNSSYIVNDDIGIFVKYSTKRMSPWQFTFAMEHCDELFNMVQNIKLVFLVLVCNDDGIACLKIDEIKNLLNKSLDKPQSITVARRPREKYRVSGGKDGKFKIKIANNQFPAIIFER